MKQKNPLSKQFSSNIDDTFNIISKIMDLSNDLFCITDENGLILTCTKQFQKRLGYYSFQDLYNKSITEVLKAFDHNIPVNTFADYHQNEKLDFLAVSNNVRPFQVDVTISEIASEASNHPKLIILLNELGKEKSMMDFEQKYVLVMNALQEITAAVYSKLDLSELFNEILEQISRVISFDSASISILEETEFVLVAEKGFLNSKNVVGLRFPVKQSNQIVSPNFQAIESRKSIRLGDVEKEYPYFVHPPEITIRSWMAIPLLTNDGGIGTLNLDSYVNNYFTEEDQWIAELFAAQVTNAIENAMAYKNVEENAKVDPLTGLLNRRYLYKFAELEMSKFHLEKYPVSIIIFDIDKFKIINDSKGHLVGDQVLKTFTEFCSKMLRRDDIFGRYGGDEFVIVMPDVHILEAEQAANRLCANISDHVFLTSKEEMHITASFGVTTIGRGDTISSAFDRADKALFVAKNQGRNQVAVKTPEV